MIEKVNPQHPDKQMDRIGGAIADWITSQDENARFAIEGLIGHEFCTVIIESNVEVSRSVVRRIVNRITGDDTIKIKLISVPQDEHLSENQRNEVRAGDNGIFKGYPLSSEELELTKIAQEIYSEYPTDGKYIFDEKSRKLIICQSCCDNNKLKKEIEEKYPEYDIVVNPLGDWTGGINVDTGAINRKLGSDQYRGISGGGINAKDISKCDVSVNIYCFLEAQRTGIPQEAFCAIGDTEINVNGKLIPYSEIVEVAKNYIDQIGGYEALAEWGLW